MQTRSRLDRVKAGDFMLLWIKCNQWIYGAISRRMPCINKAIRALLQREPMVLMRAVISQVFKSGT